jgi:hypothetical protein
MNAGAINIASTAMAFAVPESRKPARCVCTGREVERPRLGKDGRGTRPDPPCEHAGTIDRRTGTRFLLDTAPLLNTTVRAGTQGAWHAPLRSTFAGMGVPGIEFEGGARGRRVRQLENQPASATEMRIISSLSSENSRTYRASCTCTSLAAGNLLYVTGAYQRDGQGALGVGIRGDDRLPRAIRPGWCGGGGYRLRRGRGG